MNAITLRDLNVYLSGSHILQGVNFEVPSNKVTALLGRNGVGKTTTLRAIMGLIPSTGTIDFYEKTISGMPTYKIAQSGMG